MVRPDKRSRSKRRKTLRTPGGILRTYWKNRKKKTRLACANCKKILGGTLISKKASKTEKFPTRKYSGKLCASCLRETIKREVRGK